MFERKATCTNKNHKVNITMCRIFREVDTILKKADSEEKDDHITQDELEEWIDKFFNLRNDKISKDYAKTEIMTQFDDDKSGRINMSEFVYGCIKWLKKWEDDVKHSNSSSKNMWHTMKNDAIQKKRDYFTRIEKIMPRILLQADDKHELVNENEADISNIEKLFSIYAKHTDNIILCSELKKFIETLHFGVILDHESIVNEIFKDFQNNKSDQMNEDEFVQGLTKWIKTTIKHDHIFKDPKHAIANMEKQEIVESFNKLIKIVVEHDSSIKFPKHAIATMEKDEFVQGFKKWIERAIEHDPSIKKSKTCNSKV